MYMSLNQIQPPRCECHECTQARWKMSFQGQLQGPQQGITLDQIQKQHNQDLQSIGKALQNG